MQATQNYPSNITIQKECYLDINFSQTIIFSHCLENFIPAKPIYLWRSLMYVYSFIRLKYKSFSASFATKKSKFKTLPEIGRFHHFQMTLSGKPNVEIASLLSQNLSQRYLDKYFTLTIIANGQLMHLSFKHTNVDFTWRSSTNMQVVINYPESQINHSNLVYLYKRERESSLLPAHSPPRPRPESDFSNCSLTVVQRVTFSTKCYCNQCNLKKHTYIQKH